MSDPRFKSGFIDWNVLIGKTIEEVDTQFGANVVLLKFTDQTSVVVDTEVIGHGFHTPVIDDPEGYCKSSNFVAQSDRAKVGCSRL